MTMLVGKTGIVDPSALLVVFGSTVAGPALTLALFVMFRPWAVSSIDMVTVTITLLPLAILPRLQVTVLPAPDEKQEEDELDAMNVAIVAPEPAGSSGSVSVRVTPVAVAGPALLTVMLKATLLQGTLQLPGLV